MTILQIPTTAFSRCILETENEHLPPTNAQIPTLLRVAQSSQLFIHLGGRRNAERLNQSRLEKELDNVVYLSLHDHLAAATHRNVWQTGYYLNELHRDRLNEAIWWECRGLPRRSEICKLQAKQVIEAFCEHFTIELDVDINYDTLYKSWTRYRQNRESAAMNERRTLILGEKKNRKLQKKAITHRKIIAWCIAFFRRRPRSHCRQLHKTAPLSILNQRKETKRVPHQAIAVLCFSPNRQTPIARN